jgi:endonuclease YncB( thermonuclease family)
MNPAPPTTMPARLITLLLVCTAAGTAFGQPLRVVRVLDSITYQLSDGRAVRLIGIAPPERFFPAARSRGVSPGRLAARYAEALLRGRRVSVAYGAGERGAHRGSAADPVPVYLFALDEAGAPRFNVGERLLYDGYGLVDTQQPFADLSRYLALQQRAAEEGRGLWGPQPAAASPEPYETPPIDSRRVPPSRDASGIDLLGECSRHPDCEWVTGPDATLGYWRSKPNRQCPCDRQR